MKNNQFLKSVKDTLNAKNQKIMDYLAKDDSNARQKTAHDDLLACLKSLYRQADKQEQDWLCASLECFMTDFQNNWGNQKSVAWNVWDYQLKQFSDDIDSKIED